jgi:regulator of protease activity HflC (stomatin/prohibitin superfamily)
MALRIAPSCCSRENTFIDRRVRLSRPSPLIIRLFRIFRFLGPSGSEVECRRPPGRQLGGVRLDLGMNKEVSVATAFLLLIALIFLLVLSIVLGSFFTVETAQVAIVQRLGKFARVAGPGLNWKTPYLETVVYRLSMKVQQFDVQVETKTQDNVFVQIPVSIQYKVIPDAVEAAFYKLSDPVKQIESMVYNVVLGHVPKMKLDDTFLNQADIASDLRDNLDASMKEYGYSIVKVLISDIVPDQKVKAAMNDINAAQREREATVSRAETNKMLLVKQAEAEAESKRLQGEGIANQRKAIITGLKDSVEDFAKTVPGSTPQDVMQLVLMTQYFDTLKDIAANDHSNTILIPHTPNTLTDLFSQIRNAIITGTELTSHSSISPISSDHKA